MRCPDVQELLESYVAGELTAAQLQLVAAHLEECQDCRKLLARLQGLASLLRSQPLPPVPEGFADRVMAKARQRVLVRPRQPAFAGPLGWWRTTSVPMHVAAVLLCALGLAAGGFMGRDSWVRGEVSPDREVARGRITAEYNLDCLSEAPAGSLADAYLRLALAGD